MAGKKATAQEEKNLSLEESLGALEHTVGTGATEFPVLDRCGAQVVAQQLRTRRRYPFRVSTNATSGSIVLLGCLPSVESTALAALNDAAEGGA